MSATMIPPRPLNNAEQVLQVAEFMISRAREQVARGNLERAISYANQSADAATSAMRVLRQYADTVRSPTKDQCRILRDSEVARATAEADAREQA